MNRQVNDLPTRSPDGKAALDVFYSDFNDVHFYVEDEDQENLYSEILRKLFPRFRIARVFPLGGKQSVITHAVTGANDQIIPFRVYVLDRDFDYFLGTRVKHPNVFYLDRFCIENHLLEVDAMTEIVVENHPKKKREEVKQVLNIQEQMLYAHRSLRPLFVMFYFVQKLELGLKNSSHAPEAFCNAKRLWEVNETAVCKYEDELHAAASAKPVKPPIASDVLVDVRARRVALAPDHTLVSGKFVAAMLFHYLKRHYSLGSMTFDSFTFRLAKNCSLNSMRSFATRVRAGIRAHKGYQEQPHTATDGR